ncbi:MAG: hypothetical protein J6R29_01975 [Clostridia bacterium]|nr:hypothetical protein [Clostridia bacterium]
MLKKTLFLLCLFFSCILFAQNAIPYKNIEVTYGKKSNCTVNCVNVALFYESASIIKEKDFNYQKILEKTNAKLQFIEETNGVTSYYYYSSKLHKIEIVNGVKVNLHVAVSSDYIKLGTPFIYASF